MVEELKELMRVRANLNNQGMGEPPTTPHDWMAWEESCADFLRDHGQALVEALADAERYRWIREIASGDPADFHYVEDAAFVAANGCPHNFDLNIDLARTKASAGGGG